MAYQHPRPSGPSGHQLGSPQPPPHRAPAACAPPRPAAPPTHSSNTAGIDSVYSWLQNSWSSVGGLFEGGGTAGSIPLTKQCMSPSLSESHVVFNGKASARPEMKRPAGTAGAFPTQASSEPASFAGVSMGRSASRGPSRRSPPMIGYEVDKEDLLDQHVGYYFRHHSEVYAQHSIVRIRPGAYEVDGREIKVEWQHAAEPGGQGFLVVVDGPLRQPFSDYMENSEQNAEYDMNGVESASSLHCIPKEKRMSFHDQHKMYSRLEAMKVAKEQALVREKAADYVRDGFEVPSELMLKYKKTVQMKLDPGGRQRAARQKAHQEAMPSQPPPGASATALQGINTAPASSCQHQPRPASPRSGSYPWPPTCSPPTPTTQEHQRRMPGSNPSGPWPPAGSTGSGPPGWPPS